ncbi:MAG: metallopeptidase family protein [Mariprofundus sp.]
MYAEEFRLTAEHAFNALPAKFRLVMENIVIVTQEFADQDVLQQMHIDTPYDLLGLYEGSPVTERQCCDSGVLPDMIYLYRQPILAACRGSGESIEQCINDVLMHETGHFFGFSDAEMVAMESHKQEEKYGNA